MVFCWCQCGMSHWLQVLGGVSLMFGELSKIFPRNLWITKTYFLWEFQAKLCTRAQSMALGTCTKFQLEIRIMNVITGIVHFREIILESSQNVSETTPWPYYTGTHSLLEDLGWRLLKLHSLISPLWEILIKQKYRLDTSNHVYVCQVSL